MELMHTQSLTYYQISLALRQHLHTKNNQFDEYQDPKWPGAKDAIDEFFNKKGINVELDQLTKRGFVKKTQTKHY